jgi:hypothetical protein
MFHNKVSTKIKPKTIFKKKSKTVDMFGAFHFAKRPMACKMVCVKVALLAFKACSKFDNDLGSTCSHQMVPIQVLDLIIHQIIELQIFVSTYP